MQTLLSRAHTLDAGHHPRIRDIDASSCKAFQCHQLCLRSLPAPLLDAPVLTLLLVLHLHMAPTVPLRKYTGAEPRNSRRQLAILTQPKMRRPDCDLCAQPNRISSVGVPQTHSDEAGAVEPAQYEPQAACRGAWLLIVVGEVEYIDDATDEGDGSAAGCEGRDGDGLVRSRARRHKGLRVVGCGGGFGRCYGALGG